MSLNTPAFKPKQLLAINSLARGESIQKTADCVGVNEKTIDKWLKQTSFSEAVKIATHKFACEVHDNEIKKFRQTVGDVSSRMEEASSLLLSKIGRWIEDVQMDEMSDSNAIRLIGEYRSLMSDAVEYRDIVVGVTELRKFYIDKVS